MIKFIQKFKLKRNKDDFIYKCIYLKDQKYISNDTWQSLITFLKNDLAPLSQIRSKKKYLNSLIPVHENLKGVFLVVLVFEQFEQYQNFF